MIVERINPSAVLPFDATVLSVFTRTNSTSGRFTSEVLMCASAAAKELERYADLALLTQTIRVTMEEWGRKNWLPLPIAPMIDPLSPVVTVDGVAFNDYAVIAGTRPALRLTGVKPCGLVVIQYVAGFGAAETDIPADLRLAILDQASANFDVRGGITQRSDSKTANEFAISPHTARIAARYKRVAV